MQVLRILTVHLTTLLLLAACGGPEPISLGVVLPLSGPAGMEVVHQGMEMAIEEINQTGGIQGRPLQLHVADTSADDPDIIGMMEDMESTHRPLLYFSVLSSVTQMVSSAAERFEAPLVGLVATDPSIPIDKDWTYVFYPSARHEVGPIIDIIEQSAVRRVGVMYFDDGYGRSVMREVRVRSQEIDIQIEAIAYDGVATLLPELLNDADEFQALYVVGFPQHIGDAVSHLRSVSYNGQILSTSTASIPTLRQQADMEGVYVAAPLLYNERFLLARDVAAKYFTRYGNEFSHYAANGYDGIKMITGLLSQITLERTSVRDVLDGGFIYPSILGEIRLPRGERSIYFPLYPARVDADGLTYLR